MLDRTPLVGPSVNGPICLGLVTSMLTSFGIAVLATVAEISGAVIAPGVVTVETRPKLIQHQYGGIIAKINVDDGSEVKEGDVLIRLDDVQLRSQLDAVLKRLAKLKRAPRVSAEQGRLETPHFRVPSHGYEQEAILIEREQFQIRRDALLRNQSILQQQIMAKELEIKALESEVTAIEDQTRIASAQIEAIRVVYERNHSKVL
jgi:HlyD family secretion protein